MAITLPLFLKKYLSQIGWGLITFPAITLAVYLFGLITELAGIKSLDVNFFTSYVDLHPYRIFIGSSLIGVFVQNSYQLAKKSKVLASFGAFSFSEKVDNDSQDKDWMQFRDRLDKSANLSIFGATGYRTFKTRTSPLYEDLRNFNGTVSVLLLNPDSAAVKIRSSTVGMAEAEYKREINTTIKYLKKLNEKRQNIVVRLYDCDPSWKMIVADGFMWLQHYSPDAHVHETPVYGLYANEANTSLFYLMMCEYRKIWNAKSTIEIEM